MEMADSEYDFQYTRCLFIISFRYRFFLPTNPFHESLKCEKRNHNHVPVIKNVFYIDGREDLCCSRNECKCAINYLFSIFDRYRSCNCVYLRTASNFLCKLLEREYRIFPANKRIFLHRGRFISN